MSVEKILGTLFFYSQNQIQKIIKGVYYHEKHSKCNQNFEKEVLP